MSRLFLVLAAVAVCVVNASPVQEDILGVKLEDRVYPRFIEFPDGEGNMHTVDLEAEPELDLLDAARNPDNNQYILYTRRNPVNGQELHLNNAGSIHNSNFNANHPTVVVVHGWLSSANTDLNPVIRDACLNRQETNVIILDWRRLAIGGYVTAVTGVPAVGRGLGHFLEFLNSVTNIPFNRIHLVGFSLGAHVVGNAGAQLGGRIGRVTGLDPAGPLWNLNSNRLSSSDGIYVEAIHTDGGYTVGGLGIGSAIANVDFFPNGGISQPACLTNICNHNRAWELFAATVSYNHLVGLQCSSSLQITLNNCRGDRHHMGNGYASKSGSGMYRLDTDRRHPF